MKKKDGLEEGVREQGAVKGERKRRLEKIAQWKLYNF
jgi:hypothetical protein